MSRRKTTPELLAPVGSPEALTAAVRCGADAVYVGAGRFHARQSAGAFDGAALEDLLAYCHARGVAVHLTLNTLVREEEFEAALKEAQRAAQLGVDALIVQDRGLARAIRHAAPSLTLHASTQLSCHTPDGVRRLAQDGFSRVVLAREMSKDEIRACCETDCEIETFVHGALCMSVSGQCLLSAMLGGRSGNRGRCAQPCRLPFCVGNPPRDTDRALSLKDLSLWPFVHELADMGVSSLKIEGRMKRPEYVAAAVSVYRAALDGRPIDEEMLADLQHVFSRSGFTDGYYKGRRDLAMFGSRTKDDVLAAPAANKRLAQLYRRERPAVPLSMTLRMIHDEPMILTADDGEGHAVVARGEIPRIGEAPLGNNRIEAALQKLGSTPFFARAIRLEREDAADAPLSAINALRRAVTQALLAQRAAREPIPFCIDADPVVAVPRAATPALVVRLQHASQWSETLSQAALVTVPSDTATTTLTELVARATVAVEMPRGMFGNETRLRESLRAAKACGVKAAVAHNIGALSPILDAGLVPLGGFGLHTFNRQTLQTHREDALAAATLSPELSCRQMAFAALSPLPVGAMVYGRLPLMLLRNCPASAKLGCRDCHQDRTLTDRKGVTFPLVCTGGCADLLNSVPLYLLDKLDDLPPLDFHLLYMTTERASEVAEIVDAYHRRLKPSQPFTRGAAFKGVE